MHARLLSLWLSPPVVFLLAAVLLGSAHSDEFGYVHVKTAERSVKVFLDGNLVGLTKDEDKGLVLLDVVEGKHTVRAVKDGYLPQDAEVEVTGGKATVHELAAFQAQPEQAADEAAKPKTQDGLTLDLGDGVNLELVLIPAGEFFMGSPPNKWVHGKDEVQHKVKLTKPFYIGRYEVTQEQFRKVLGYYSSEFDDSRRPADTVTWDKAQAFCQGLSRMTKQNVRLPTEAEWEYACRAGSLTLFCSGDAMADLDKVAWHRLNSDKQTQPVGGKKPNAWNLYDMHGNVSEWCSDWYGNYEKGDAVDPTGPAIGDVRVRRGGSCTNDPFLCRSALRFNNLWDDPQSPHTGLRVVVQGEYVLNPAIEAAIKKANGELVNLFKNEILDKDGRYSGLRGRRLENVENAVKRGLALEPYSPELLALRSRLPQPKRLVLDIGEKITLELVLIPPGKFKMGSPPGAHKLELPQHEVTISRQFYLGRFEVTQEQYKQVMGRLDLGRTLTHKLGPKIPAYGMYHEQAKDFCRRLANKFDREVRLPTEAEWEYACRAGTQTEFNTGNSITTTQANFMATNANSRHDPKNKPQPRVVGSYPPNAWGLYDMHGNVAEWCQGSFRKYTSIPKVDPITLDPWASGVVRGGDFGTTGNFCRSAARSTQIGEMDTERKNIGFRVVVAAFSPPTKKEEKP